MPVKRLNDLMDNSDNVKRDINNQKRRILAVKAIQFFS
jgi:hypothetical protein